MNSTHDVFFVLNPFRDNVTEFQILVRPLSDLGPNHVVGADGYYAASIDTALLVLRFPKQLLDHWGSKIISVFTARTGLPMIVPADLSARDRRRFYIQHVSIYDTYVQQYFDPTEPQPLPARVLERLKEHLPQAPTRNRSVDFDPRVELPIRETNATRHARRQMRLDSVDI